MRAKTAKSSDKREASTTDDEMAAFIDNTDVSLSEAFRSREMIRHSGREAHHILTYHVVGRMCVLDCNPQVTRSTRREMRKEPK